MVYRISRISSLLILVPTLLLTGCTDLMLDDTASINQHYGYNSHYYYAPQPVRQPVRRVQSNSYYQAVQYNHYYQAPHPVYYQQAPRAQHHHPVYQQPAPAQHNAHQARQAQIASDRAMAQRLQNEEYVRAHREVEQIASDRALAERLQAAEYAQ